MVVLNLAKQLYIQYDPANLPSKYVTVVSGQPVLPDLDPGKKGVQGIGCGSRDFLFSV